MDVALKRELVAYLAGFVSQRRRERMERVLAGRTRLLTVVMEEVYHPHNASAVLRSCEFFGVQDVHVVAGENEYQINPQIAVGSSRWLTLKRYADSASCLAALREDGYRLVATTPHEEDCTLDELPVDGKIALLFGTEDEGLAEKTMALADQFVRIPIYGFTESFNVSVCTALILRELTGRMRTSGLDWELAEGEKLDLRLEWYRKSVKSVELLEKRFLEERERTSR
jgi:tRNA (guanosine-2'-O-)-methyltransferase